MRAWVPTPVDLPPEQMSYWCRHGHLPRDSTWTHDLKGRDLEERTDDRCVSDRSPHINWISE
jgi:hypothetical protein